MGIHRALAVTVSIAALTGCGAAAAPAASKPLTCHQQYETWKTYPLYHADRQRVKAAVTAVETASSSQDIPALASALRSLGPPVRALAAYPMPRCADPAGYYGQFLSRLRAAADNAGSAKGLMALMLAMAPLKQLGPIAAMLQAELKRTAQA